MKKIITIGIILLINSMAITAAASNNDWVTFQHDNKRTGYTNGIGNIQSPTLSTLFSASADLSYPVVHNGIIFVGTDDGGVYAIKECNDVKWSRTTLDSADSLAVADGVLYVGSNDGAVYAFSVTNGNEEWSRTILGNVLK